MLWKLFSILGQYDQYGLAFQGTGTGTVQPLLLCALLTVLGAHPECSETLPAAGPRVSSNSQLLGISLGKLGRLAPLPSHLWELLWLLQGCFKEREEGGEESGEMGPAEPPALGMPWGHCHGHGLSLSPQGQLWGSRGGPGGTAWRCWCRTGAV